ncbi:uncharacterized protein LOC129182631 [Dunckerocampus dactyliophorus]|uniref:uncharacterized protein LOC129182631 n=1 Tax=Dunckerocampus dactyliophorus TaxID=161453 RepID=UPI0024053BB6|nr:uncharacterized protein LOC129182631 [Dunckerocampus dactyliophorus]
MQQNRKDAHLPTPSKPSGEDRGHMTDRPLTDRPLTTAQARASYAPQDTPQALTGSPGRPVWPAQPPRDRILSTPKTGAPPEAASTMTSPNRQTPGTSHTPKGRPDCHQNSRDSRNRIHAIHPCPRHSANQPSPHPPPIHQHAERDNSEAGRQPPPRKRRQARHQQVAGTARQPLARPAPKPPTKATRRPPHPRVSIPPPIPASTMQKNTSPSARKGTRTPIRPGPHPAHIHHSNPAPEVGSSCTRGGIHPPQHHAPPFPSPNCKSKTPHTPRVSHHAGPKKNQEGPSRPAWSSE